METLKAVSPARPAAVLLAVVGLGFLATGILQSTVFAPAAETAARLTSVAGAPVVVTAPGVLALGGGAVRVQADAGAAQPVFIGIGRADDVDAYLQQVARREITGLGDDGSMQVNARGGEASLPDPAQVDVWVASVRAPGSAALGWVDAPGQWRLVVATNGVVAPESVTLTWARGPVTSSAPALIAVGLLILILGAIGLVAARPGGRFDRGGSRPGDDADDGDSDDGDDGHDDDDGHDSAPATPGTGLIRPVGAGQSQPAGVRSGRRHRTGHVIGGALAPLALSALLLVSACAADPRTGPASGPDAPHPVVAPRQAQQILSVTQVALDRSLKSGDPNQLGARVIGPSRELTVAQLKVARALKRSPQSVGAIQPHLLVPLAQGWPRWFLAAGAAPQLPTPVLRVYVSGSAREPYGLWGELTLLPGAVLPDFAPATRGAKALAPTATGLVDSPMNIALHYVDVLNRGLASPYAARFGPDDFRAQLQTRLTADRRAFGPGGSASVTSTHTLAADSVRALASTENGALVIVRLDQRYVIDVRKSNWSVQVPADLAVLAGLAPKAVQAGTRFERTSVELLAFSVPAAGSTDPVTLVAASKADVLAAAS